MPLRFIGFLALLAASAPPLANVYDSPQGGFAFKIPPGWEVKTQKEETFPALFGPKDDPGAPYVVVKEVAGTKDLIELTNATVREMQKDQIYQLASRDAFQTADKKDGYKYVFTTINEPHYRQAMYFVEGPADRIFVILATLPEAGWKKYELILDNLAQSYHLRPLETPKGAATPSAPETPLPPAKPAPRSPGK